jgi:hypothetical protein
VSRIKIKGREVAIINVFAGGGRVGGGAISNDKMCGLLYYTTHMTLVFSHNPPKKFS